MYTEFPCHKIFPLHNFQKRDCLRIVAHTFGIGLLLLMSTSPPLTHFRPACNNEGRENNHSLSLNLEPFSCRIRSRPESGEVTKCHRFNQCTAHLFDHQPRYEGIRPGRPSFCHNTAVYNICIFTQPASSLSRLSL